MMFRDSKLPPIQLPLDYSVHSRRTAVTTKNKIGESPTHTLRLYIRVGFLLFLLGGLYVLCLLISWEGESYGCWCSFMQLVCYAIFVHAKL